METDLKIVIALLTLVCLMWTGGIWFICSFYKCDHDCIYCGDDADDCPFCRDTRDALPSTEIDRIADELKKDGVPCAKDAAGAPVFTLYNTKTGDQ